MMYINFEPQNNETLNKQNKSGSIPNVLYFGSIYTIFNMENMNSLFICHKNVI